MSGGEEHLEERNGDHENLVVDKQLSELAGELYSKIGFLQSDRLNWEESFAERKIEVVRDNAEKRHERLPPLSEWVRQAGEKRLRIYYNEPTIDHLEIDLAHIEGVDEEVIDRLYIGVAVAGFITEEIVKPTALGINIFYDKLTNEDSLLRRLGDIDYENDTDILSVEFAIRDRNPDQMARTNVLRLCLGLYLYSDVEGSHTQVGATEELDNFRHPLSEAFQDGLRLSLGGKQTYVSAMKAFGHDEITAEHMWGESLSDMRIAGAFPMAPDEIMDVLSSINQRS